MRNRTLRMFFTELVPTSKNVCPLDRGVNKQFLVQTVLDQPKCSATFQVGDCFATGRVAQCIPDFNPVQWREVQRIAGSRDVARRLRSVTIFCHQ